MLESTPAAVNSALRRARSGFRPGNPDRVALPRSPQEAGAVARFVDAFEQGDVDALVALLTDDARVTMPPEPFEFRGPRAIAEFFGSLGFWGHGLKMVPTRANNQPAFGYYRPDPNASILRAGGLLVVSVTGDQISAITRFGGCGLLAQFGLPRTLPNTGSWRSRSL